MEEGPWPQRRDRITLLRKHWPALVAAAWEELRRQLVPQLDRRTSLARLGPWGPGIRWWMGNSPEWDLVSISQDGSRLLLGEIKWSFRTFTRPEVDRP